MTIGSGNDGLVGKFKKCGHLRTFPDIQAWRPGLEEASMSWFGADRLFIEVFSVINCHVASVALLYSSASGGIFVLHMYYGREVFYYVARGKCQFV